VSREECKGYARIKNNPAFDAGMCFFTSFDKSERPADMNERPADVNERPADMIKKNFF
jgi:hypothetical protein